MKKTVKIEGMMCKGCSGAVKGALEALAEVDEAIVCHVSGTAEITLNAELSDEAITKAIEDNDFTIIEIENN